MCLFWLSNFESSVEKSLAEVTAEILVSRDVLLVRAWLLAYSQIVVMEKSITGEQEHANIFKDLSMYDILSCIETNWSFTVSYASPHDCIVIWISMRETKIIHNSLDAPRQSEFLNLCSNQ